ncbi:MAG: phosphoglucosamine mutase [Solirubrobacteraceae bacterium]|jgi:phosphoglucosamine mutase
MGRTLFGTDGVRGVAGIEITGQLALALGRAVVNHSGLDAPRALVIRDTRESGEMLEAALASGIASAGGDVSLGGVLPTPAAPLLVARHSFDLAAVISASHNPYTDNGIKFFGSDGFKLSDDTEREIELHIDEDSGGGERIGRIRRLEGGAEDYVGELERRFAGLSLDGVDVVLDCAHGATFEVAPEIFTRLGATVTALCVTPDGRNINADCGSTHLHALASAVCEGGHDLGFAFDGDGDRMLAVDRHGNLVDGDELLALAAIHLRDRGRLAGGGVAVTVMTNFGFHTAMAQAGIEVTTTPVGDRYVLEALRERGWTLGGEQSGHIIEMGFAPSGDGIAAALLVLEALDGGDLHERAAMAKLPQRLVNVRLPDRGALLDAAAMEEAVAAASAKLDGRGRVLVRRSGTEPLVRVMVEAPSVQETDEVCARLVAVVEELLG